MIDEAIVVIEALVPYWSFVAVAALLAYVGQWVKKHVWTKEHAAKAGFWGHVARYGRVTYALHPVVLGWCVGYVHNLDVPDWVSANGHNWYFALAGLASAYLYSVVRTYVKRSYEYDLKLPFVR